MTVKDWTDLLTGGGAAISAIAAGVAAWASRTSARAAKESSEATRETLAANERIANNDWRIRLMDERMQVWRAFDDLMIAYVRGRVSHADIDTADPKFQKAYFLFEPEVSDFLHELIFNMLLFIQNHEWLMSGAVVMTKEEDRDKIHGHRLKEKMKVEAWLYSQQEAGKNLFKKHMSLID
ncbi:hypothetical protein [Buttiauxella brennerae]|uniref:hypothetical protein n=1 Tax=Buttiauxella brennerae TaxID=82988 RepID=UPI00286F9E2D|nr:hypothetical protein [Buttiauxella brennerae]